MALVELIDTEAPETADVAVADLVVVAEFRDYIYPAWSAPDGWSAAATNGPHGDQRRELPCAGGADLHPSRKDRRHLHRSPYNTVRGTGNTTTITSSQRTFIGIRNGLRSWSDGCLLLENCSTQSDQFWFVTIDEKEYLRLGLLLEQLFPDAEQQMVTIVINPNGVARGKELARVEEYAFFVFLEMLGPRW